MCEYRKHSRHRTGDVLGELMTQEDPMTTRASGRHRLGDYTITDECAEELRVQRQAKIGEAVNAWNRRLPKRRHRNLIDDFLEAYPVDMRGAIRPLIMKTATD